MCGIAAAFLHRPEDIHSAQNVVHEMLMKLKHRGYYSTLSTSSPFGQSIMGCVRLPIRNPIAGQQPAFNQDYTVAALLNGEIYNVGELSGELDCNSNDTAILPLLYRKDRSEKGDVSRLLACRGMYALIVHDRVGPAPKAYVLRDHVGIKPLFLLHTDQGIFFASEKKAFSLDAFHDTYFDSIREVLPGELITLEYADSTWKLLDAKIVTNALRTGGDNVPATAIELRNLISASIAKQWPVEDLPVAVLCSGGIDSSIVTHELAKHVTERQQLIAYTARCVTPFSASKSADAIVAEQLCASLNIQLREVKITYDDLFNVIGDVIYHVESFEPNIVRNAAIQYHVMRQIAADGFRVAFCGEGADELFWGYADFAGAADREALADSLLDDLYRTQLQRVDRVSMAHTLEVRVPLLDEKIVSFSRRLTESQKALTTCGMWLGKGLLREAYVGCLPDEIVLRRKATFAYGAGFGGVEMNDAPMNTRSAHLLETLKQSTHSVAKRYPAAFKGEPANPERALYVHLFHSFGYSIQHDYIPPMVARLEQSTGRCLDV